MPGPDRTRLRVPRRSAINSTPSAATTSSVPCRNSVTPSTATAPTTAVCSAPHTASTATNPAAEPPSANTSWVP
ncbi:Uncharacterised protein [Mycobacteroides abscessus subsp. abscessus]|nr:Uncharacterised protein [Mycobacteroides abscessus subsp. abscessus]